MRQLPLSAARFHTANMVLVLLALIASSIAFSSTECRKDFAGSDPPAALRRVEHERAVLVEIAKPADERTALEADADPLAKPARRCEPGGAHRSKALLAPAPHPTREMPNKAVEQHRRAHAGNALRQKRGGREFDIFGRRDDIDADPDHDEIDAVARARFRFEEDAGDLLAVDQQ